MGRGRWISGALVRLIIGIMLGAQLTAAVPVQASPPTATPTVTPSSPLPAPNTTPTQVVEPSPTIKRVAPRVAGGPGTFTITAAGGWVDTGFTVNVGDVISGTASGSWSPGFAYSATGPNGQSFTWPDNFLNLADIGSCGTCEQTKLPDWGGLIGYIESNPPGFGSYTSTGVLPEAQRVFFLGSAFNTSAAFAGTLWLGFNDDAYSGDAFDNTGSVAATLSISLGASATFGACALYRGCSADPVDTASGNFPYQHTDLAISGRGGGVTFTRAYNSEDTRVGPLGPGWTDTYNAHVVDNGTSVQVVRGNGRTDTLGLQGTSYVAPQGVFDTLQKVSLPDGTTYLLTQVDQSELGFDANGRLLYLKDRFGNETSLGCNTSGQLTTISDPAGRGSLTLGYDPTSGRLTSVSDWLSPARTVQYGYDSNGRLSTVTDRDSKVTTYGYDGTTSHLTTITDANNHVALTLTYDGQGRVSTQKDALGLTTGQQTTFSYVTNPDGTETTTVTYPQTSFDGANPTVTDTYDTAGRLVKRVSQPSANGNRTTMSDGTGSTSYSYDEMDRLLAVTSPGSKTVGYRYDLDGNRTKVIYPDSTAVTYAFDKGSQLASLLDWANRTTSYQYLPDGSLQAVTNVDGSTSHFAYDNALRLTQVSNQSGSTPLDQHSYTLDNVGNRTALSENLDRLGVGPFTNNLTYGYDHLSRLTSATESIPQFEALGQAGVTATVGTSAGGTAEAVPYTPTFSGTVSQLSVYLDASNTATSLIVGLYTNAGSGDPGSLLTEGTISSPVAGAWNTVTIPTTTVSADTPYWIAVLGPNGTGTLAYRDTTNGTKAEASSQTTLSDLPTSWTVGAVSSIAPLSAYATVQVATPLFGDTATEQNREQQPAGVAEAFRYTATTSGTTNQIGLYLDAGSTAPQVVVGLYSDSSGNPGSLLATGTLSSPVAGAWNLVTIPGTAISANTPYWIAILDPGSTGAVSFRDTAAGGASVTSSSSALTSLPATWSSGSTSSTSPLSAYVALVGGTTSTTYSYDPVGNRLTKNATTYTYDRADRILTAGGTTYTVNANGNLTNRGSDTFAYDQANRLTSATVSGVTSTDTYDGDGKRASQTVGTTTTNYVYDVNGSLPNVLTDGTNKYVYGLGLAYAVDGSGNVQVYHIDGLGSVRAITNGSGALIQTDQTDAFGIPTSTQGTSTQPFGFTGQQVDGDGLVYLRAREYDPTSGRFIQRDLDGGSLTDPPSTNRFIYVQDNPANSSDPTGLRSKLKGLPVLVIDADKMPTKALHILVAQDVLGYPTVLTRDTNVAMRRRRRMSVCKNWNTTLSSCDEYPFASTYEGGDAGLSTSGRAASTFGIPILEQKIEGGTISRFYQDNEVQDGDQFLVEVRFSGPPSIPVPLPLPIPGIGTPDTEPAPEPVPT